MPQQRQRQGKSDGVLNGRQDLVIEGDGMNLRMVQAERKGQLTGASGDQFANNAVARCAVFKMEEDKRACVDVLTDSPV